MGEGLFPLYMCRYSRQGKNYIPIWGAGLSCSPLNKTEKNMNKIILGQPLGNRGCWGFSKRSVSGPAASLGGDKIAVRREVEKRGHRRNYRREPPSMRVYGMRQ